MAAWAGDAKIAKIAGTIAAVAGVVAGVANIANGLGQVAPPASGEQALEKTAQTLTPGEKVYGNFEPVHITVPDDLAGQPNIGIVPIDKGSMRETVRNISEQLVSLDAGAITDRAGRAGSQFLIDTAVSIGSNQLTSRAMSAVRSKSLRSLLTTPSRSQIGRQLFTSAANSIAKSALGFGSGGVSPVIKGAGGALVLGPIGVLTVNAVDFLISVPETGTAADASNLSREDKILIREHVQTFQINKIDKNQFFPLG